MDLEYWNDLLNPPMFLVPLSPPMHPIPALPRFSTVRGISMVLLPRRETGRQKMTIPAHRLLWRHDKTTEFQRRPSCSL